MNQLERDQLGLKLTELAMLYGKDFPKEHARMYINSLISFMPDTFENYLKALNAYCQDSKNRTFPAPINLRQYLNPEVSEDAIAVDSASRVIEAVSKFGWSNGGAAKEYIGDIGWKTVKVFGGWSYVCENLGTNISVSTFNAQAREISKAQIQRSKAGLGNEAIEISYVDKDAQLNDKKRESILKLVDSIKTIEEKT